MNILVSLGLLLCVYTAYAAVVPTTLTTSETEVPDAPVESLVPEESHWGRGYGGWRGGYGGGWHHGGGYGGRHWGYGGGGGYGGRWGYGGGFGWGSGYGHGHGYGR